MQLWAIWVVALVVAATSTAQDSKFPDLSGFTESPTEHLIVTVDRPFSVRSVRGSTTFQSTGEPLPSVLFEIMGPGEARTVRRAVSGDNGKFKIAHVPEGSYRFKTTLNGFSSVVGVLVVSKHAPPDSRIHIEVPIGN